MKRLAPKASPPLTAALLAVVLLAGKGLAQQPEPAKETRKELPFLQVPVTVAKDVTMKVNALAWFRYTWNQSAQGATNGSAFSVRAARLKFSGDLPKKFKYSFMFAFERANGATASQNSALYDYMLIYAPTAYFNLTAGQFTVPVGAEVMTPTDQLDFASRYYAQDRILNPSFNHDVGVMASGKALDQRLQYWLGVFNGSGANLTANDNGDMLYASRLQWVPVKAKLLGLDSTLTLGGNAMWKRTMADPSSLKSTDLAAVSFQYPYHRIVYGGDLAWKLGPARLSGEFIGARLDGQVKDPDVRAYGWHVTAACRFLSEKLEALVRYQVYDPYTRVKARTDMDWTTLGLNWFINGQNLRLTVNHTIKNERIDRVRNDESVAQLQVGF
ncbi:MAG: hypothetical protein HY924_07500 [Elusimicrobia bacterium]|nr:hypothetical protein [Elusimicrobiota bacterium]